MSTINHADPDVTQVAAALADACHAGGLSAPYYRNANDALERLRVELSRLKSSVPECVEEFKQEVRHRAEQGYSDYIYVASNHPSARRCLEWLATITDHPKPSTSNEPATHNREVSAEVQSTPRGPVMHEHTLRDFDAAVAAEQAALESQLDDPQAGSPLPPDREALLALADKWDRQVLYAYHECASRLREALDP